MPNLFERAQEWATRNLDKKQPAQPEPGVKTKPKRERPAPTGTVVDATAKPVDKFVAFIRASVGGTYCSPPNPPLYKKPRCTDCSGNVAWAYYQATGKRIAGDGGSHEQFNAAGRLLKRGKNPEPWVAGDLLFYNTTGEVRAGNRASHVAVYIGNGRAVSAMNVNQGIQEHATNSDYWNRRFLGARRLWEIASGDTEQPHPGAEPKPVTEALAPITPAAAIPVTKDTPMRAVPPIRMDRWQTILTDAGSPMAPEAAAIWAACGPLLTVAGAQSYKESVYGKMAAARNNPLGLMEMNGSTLKTYDTWAAAFADWWNRITNSAYKSGVYSPRNMTLEQFIVIYVGGPDCWATKGQRCGNGETWKPGGPPSSGSINLYLYQTIARINRYHDHYQPDPIWADYVWEGEGEEQPGDANGYIGHRIEGTDKLLYLPKDVPFNIMLTPVWRTCNRSGKRLNWQGIRQHETGNPGVGTGAEMHAGWQYRGTEGHPDGCVAVHFYVGDDGIWQTLPVNEQGIHSGDAGNQTQVAIEKAVNSDRDEATAYRYTVALEAGLHHIAGFNPYDHMWMHHETAGCPPGLRAKWGTFERDVQNALDAIVAAL